VCNIVHTDHAMGEAQLAIFLTVSGRYPAPIAAGSKSTGQFRNNQKEIDALRAELKEQRPLVQEVNDKVQLNRRASQSLADNR
jgi:hypothetical protein